MVLILVNRKIGGIIVNNQFITPIRDFDDAHEVVLPIGEMLILLVDVDRVVAVCGRSDTNGTAWNKLHRLHNNIFAKILTLVDISYCHLDRCRRVGSQSDVTYR